jgi:hypothetical protein
MLLLQAQHWPAVPARLHLPLLFCSHHSPPVPQGKAEPCTGKGGAAALAPPGARTGTSPCHAYPLVYTSQPGVMRTARAASCWHSARLPGGIEHHLLQSRWCSCEPKSLQEANQHALWFTAIMLCQFDYLQYMVTTLPGTTMFACPWSPCCC